MWFSKLTKAKVLLSTLLFSIAVSGLPVADAQTRPQSLNGLPEETLQLYDEYRLCMKRTGQKGHLGSFGPCDEALFQFGVSRAKATGSPVPVREPVNNWKSAKGPSAQYKVRTAGTDFIFYEAPADFTPEMPDTQKFRPPFSIRLEFNKGKFGRLWKIRLSAFGSLGVYGRSRTYYRSAGTPVFQDFTNLGKAGNDTLLECIYESESTNRLTGIRAHGVEATAAVTVYRGDSVFYWHKTIPEAAAAENLKFRASETHPAFLVMNAVDECPPVLTAETRQRRAILLSAPPPPINPWSRGSVSQVPEN